MEELEPVDQLVVEGVLLQPAVQQVRPGRPSVLQASGSRRRGSEYVVNLLKILQNMHFLSYSVHIKRKYVQDYCTYSYMYFSVFFFFYFEQFWLLLL